LMLVAPKNLKYHQDGSGILVVTQAEINTFTWIMAVTIRELDKPSFLKTPEPSLHHQGNAA
jgi:hypothetical protein